MNLNNITNLLQEAKISSTSVNIIITGLSSIMIELDIIADEFANSLPNLLKEGKNAVLNERIQNYEILNKEISEIKQCIYCFQQLESYEIEEDPEETNIDHCNTTQESNEWKPPVIQNHIKTSSSGSSYIPQLQEIKNIEFTILKNGASHCPTCGSNLSVQASYYSIFTDETRTTKEPTGDTITRYCRSCRVIYIESEILKIIEDNIGLARTNIAIKQQSGTAKCKQFGCDDVLYKDGYCRYHYNYEKAESK